MATGEALHQHVQRGFARTVDFPETTVLGNASELRRHYRHCTMRRYEGFEQLDDAHGAQRIGDHQLAEVGDIDVGRRVLARRANARVHEQHFEAFLVHASAQRAHLIGIIDVDRLDGKASRKAGREGIEPLRGPTRSSRSDTRRQS